MATEKKKTAGRKAIDRKNSEAARLDSIELLRSASAPNPGFQKFTQATGVKDKAKVVAQSSGSNAKCGTGKNIYRTDKSTARFEKRQG